MDSQLPTQNIYCTMADELFCFSSLRSKLSFTYQYLFEWYQQGMTSQGCWPSVGNYETFSVCQTTKCPIHGLFYSVKRLCHALRSWSLATTPWPEQFFLVQWGAELASADGFDVTCSSSAVSNADKSDALNKSSVCINPLQKESGLCICVYLYKTINIYIYSTPPLPLALALSLSLAIHGSMFYQTSLAINVGSVSFVNQLVAIGLFNGLLGRRCSLFSHLQDQSSFGPFLIP